MIGDRYYVTVHQGAQCAYWDLRSGEPHGASVRIANGEAFNPLAALHQATNALARQLQARSYTKGST